MSTSQTIARNSLWLMLDTIASMIATTALSVAVARVLGPDKLGYYNYVTWVAGMAQLIADMGVALATRKFASELRGRGDLATLRAVVSATGSFQRSVAAVVTVSALAVTFTVVPSQHRPYAALVALSLCPALLLGVPSALLWATENLAWGVWASVAGILTSVVVTAIALVLRWDLPGLAGALLASRCVDLALRYVFFRRAYASIPKEVAPLPPELRKRIVRFCWHQTLLLVLEVVVWNRSEIFLLERFSEIRQVAFYSLAFGLSQSILLLPRLMSASTGATLMVKQGEAPERVGSIATTATWYVALFATPAMLGVAALADPLLRVAYGQRYVDAIPVMTVCATFGIARAMSFPILEVLFATERQRFVVRWSVAMLVLNAIVSLLWIPSHGAIGAAWAKGVTQVGALAGPWIYASREAALRVPMIRLAKLLFSSAMMAVVVRVATQRLPPVLALASGVPLGVLVLAVALKVLRCLDAEDQRRLALLQRFLPGPARRAYLGLLRLVTPPADDGQAPDSPRGPPAPPAGP